MLAHSILVLVTPLTFEQPKKKSSCATSNDVEFYRKCMNIIAFWRLLLQLCRYLKKERKEKGTEEKELTNKKLNSKTKGPFSMSKLTFLHSVSKSWQEKQAR